MWLRPFLAVALAALPISVASEPAVTPYYASLDGDGQYHVTPQINHHAVKMLVDTGASDILISKDAAASLDLPHTGRLVYYIMADGRLSPCQRVLADTFQLGAIRRSKVIVSVCERGSVPLLGSSVIRTFRVTITHDGIMFEDK